MPSIQHKTIPDTEVHEPKNISTATNGQIYVANGSGSGVWKKLNEVDNFDYSVKAKNKFGWNDISDSQYTSGSPLAITSGTRTLLPNNGLGSQSDTTRLGSLWQAGSSKFVINDLNAFYILRVNFKVTAAAAASVPYTILVDIDGGSPVVTFGSYNSFVKGGSYINKYSVAIPFYVGSYINNTDLKVYLTPDTNVNVYDIGFLLQRTYVES
jgi:hypothetical protein